MDKAVLVNVDFDRGTELLAALDQAGLKTSVALWLCSSVNEDWRLIVSSRRFDSLDLREAYRLLHASSAAGGVTIEKMPPVTILPMNDPFIKRLRQIFGKARSVEGMRLGGQMIGDRFVQDGYVYRIA